VYTLPKAIQAYLGIDTIEISEKCQVPAIIYQITEAYGRLSKAIGEYRRFYMSFHVSLLGSISFTIL